MGRRQQTPAPRPGVRLLAFLAGMAAFLLYLPSLGSGFVYDAEEQILADGYIHDRSKIVDVLTLKVLGEDVLDENRPMQLLLLMADSICWGKNPFGYHLTTNLLHAANTALVFLLIVALGRAEGRRRGWGPELEGPLKWGALLAALLFAFHPVNAEPIAEVSSREDALATFFILMSLWCAGKFDEAPGRKRLAWAAGCVAAALLGCAAKETGVAIVPLVGLYGLLFRRGAGRAWVGLTVAVGAVAGAFFAARFGLQPKVSHIFLQPPTYLGGSLGMVFEIQPRLWAFLVKNVLWPTGLSADYVPQNVAWLSLPMALVALGILVAIQGVLAWKSRLALFGAAIFWIGLAPVSNFVPLYRPLADRFLYLPMVGVALTVAGVLLMSAGWAALFRCLAGVVGLSLVPLGVLTLQRQVAFSSPLHLWEDTLRKSPASDTAANNLGFALLDLGKYNEALGAFARALQLTQEKKADAWAGAALAFEDSGQPAKADAALGKAIALEPIYGDPDKLLRALMTTPEKAEVFRKIVARRSGAP